MRKLASIQSIRDIKPIEGADSICAYQIKDWWVVDSIGKYAIGAIIIYCEPDSWIPNTLAPFLSKGKEPREYEGIMGERLRTVKLRGQISQGLIISCKTNRYSDNQEIDLSLSDIGADVSEIMGIKKYEPTIPACLAGVVKGVFPDSIPKTDEERIQNLTADFDRLKDQTFEVTEKLEGSSGTYALIDNEFIVCSRNLNLAESEGNTFWKLAVKNDIATKMKNINLEGIVIQGEVIGEGIQGNYYGIKGQEFYVFRMWNTNTAQFIDTKERVMLAKKLGLKHVPIINPELDISNMDAQDLLWYADGRSIINADKLREGVVLKSTSTQDHFKVVSNSYLIKSGN